MTNLLMKFYSEHSEREKVKRLTKVYDVSDYDATFNIPRTVLRLVGLRLTRNDSMYIRLFWSTFYWIEFVNLFVVTWMVVAEIVQKAKGGTFGDAVQIFGMMPCMGYLLLAMSKSYKIEVHRPVYENLVSELRDMWPRGEVSDKEHDVIRSALRHLNQVVKGYYWCNNALLVMFLSPPFVIIVKVALGYEGSYILPFFYWFPFDPIEHGYVVILMAQTWHGLLTIWFMLCGDLLFCIFLSHITTQFDLLAVRIRRLVYIPVDRQLVDTYPLGEYCLHYANKHTNIVNTFNDNDWEASQRQELKEIIIRHRALIRLAGDVENMFGFPLLVNFFNSSIIICFCGFCCVLVEKWNELNYKFFLISVLSQTWLICWYGQRLLESSARVADALYECGWYNASQSIKSSIFIMLQRSHKNVYVTTYGFSVISLASYTTIIKTSWSYFTLLLNIYKK